MNKENNINTEKLIDEVCSKVSGQSREQIRIRLSNNGDDVSLVVKEIEQELNAEKKQHKNSPKKVKKQKTGYDEPSL